MMRIADASRQCFLLLWLTLKGMRLYALLWFYQSVLFVMLYIRYGFKPTMALIGRRRVNGHSMEPTVRQGDYILTERVRLNDAIHRGDILIFDAPGDAEVSMKRLCGLPGETISLSRGGLIVDGQVIDEPYVSHRFNPQGPYESFEWALKENELLFLGDNRFDSLDSRRYGPVPRSAVTRRVVVAEDGEIGIRP